MMRFREVGLTRIERSCLGTDNSDEKCGERKVTEVRRITAIKPGKRVAKNEFAEAMKN